MIGLESTLKLIENQFCILNVFDQNSLLLVNIAGLSIFL